MDNVLSYNRKSNGEDWFSLTGQYNEDDIKAIKDPNGGLAEHPKTAIPSPFAQLDLVKNAFEHIAKDPRLLGSRMDMRLVSQALDIAQVFYNFDEMKSMYALQLVEWNMKHIQMLLDSPDHRLLGETLQMFINRDATAYNFSQDMSIYFIMYGNQVIGSTSPASLFMASPNANCIEQIQVEQGKVLFGEWRNLWERNPKFVKYVYAMFTAFPELKRMCSEVNNYLIENFKMMEGVGSDYVRTRNEIITEIGNPETADQESAMKAREYLNRNYMPIENGVNVLGFPLYRCRQEDVTNAIAESDFVIVPSLPEAMAETRKPLVLQNNLNTLASDPFIYVTYPWDNSTVITPDMYREQDINKRVLPATTHLYPWLTDDDFFLPTMIKLDFPIDADCFFDGNIKSVGRDVDENSFLLPLKPTFFKYFTMKDLMTGTVAGQPVFEMQHLRIGGQEAVKAILRIRVRKTEKNPYSFVTLQRTYVEAVNGDMTYDTTNNYGKFVSIPFAIAMFPFARRADFNRYHVQLIDRALGNLAARDISLEFYRNGLHERIAEPLTRRRSLKHIKNMGSAFYTIPTDFDIVNVVVTDDRGQRITEGLIAPQWIENECGTSAFTFAVDFGTTNTHVESMRDEQLPQPLKIENENREKLVATLYNGSDQSKYLFEIVMRQEFIPKVLGTDYGFPQRTVLSECERLDTMRADCIEALGDANIPFIYEKESVGIGNRIIANLKWSTHPANKKRISCYLTELALIIRAKVLLDGGDMRKTRLVWFYPLSMQQGNIENIKRTWGQIMKSIFGIEATDENLIRMPESIAPYYFYKAHPDRFKAAASTVASIDIGGGTSDVAVFEENSASPTLLTSFRFAANSIFGDAYSDIPQGDTNPMLRKYVEYFKSMFDNDEDKYGELNGILDDITEKRKSEDINAFLFSVENNKATKNNPVFSYNELLNTDSARKLIFIYFYVTLIYYVAKMMKKKNLQKPRNVMFSGTGSKVLDIVGSQEELNMLTQTVFEEIYGEKYDAGAFSVVKEKDKPKQITCQGGLYQIRDRIGMEQVKEVNDELSDYDNTIRTNFTMTNRERITYADMEDAAKRQAIVAEIVEEVRRYNKFFSDFCDRIHVTDRFLVDVKSINIFRETINRDLEHHLVQGWEAAQKNKEEKNENDEIADKLFFYPIVGSIRYNLIENLE
ncbi:hypothetical protein [Prevotella sp. OH937_COT-195]|uniref:hypothetical protein n=1 Tax=Prevotella sp. OH937_COT-195 TaxID=2491051 RepID=UPI000F64DE4F|nr:hypothetical protein [Prevotella sp. OH937_COT-195]RRC99516.1 hypothetical protein EII32_07880 [Prevotella sp. OH937_COT-195]